MKIEKNHTLPPCKPEPTNERGGGRRSQPWNADRDDCGDD